MPSRYNNGLTEHGYWDMNYNLQLYKRCIALEGHSYKVFESLVKWKALVDPLPTINSGQTYGQTQLTAMFTKSYQIYLSIFGHTAARV